MSKFKVGQKIRATRHSYGLRWYKRGDEFIVKGINWNGNPEVFLPMIMSDKFVDADNFELVAEDAVEVARQNLERIREDLAKAQEELAAAEKAAAMFTRDDIKLGMVVTFGGEYRFLAKVGSGYSLIDASFHQCNSASSIDSLVSELNHMDYVKTNLTVKDIL
jgi:hypothetical protein